LRLFTSDPWRGIVASVSDVDDVRLNTNVSEDDDTFTFAVLSGYVDALGVAGASAKVWDQKAAIAADLVDVSEAGASERLSQMQAAAVAQADRWRGVVLVESGGTGRAKSHKMTRTSA
jgi:hypothetical protein